MGIVWIKMECIHLPEEMWSKRAACIQKMCNLFEVRQKGEKKEQRMFQQTIGRGLISERTYEGLGCICCSLVILVIKDHDAHMILCVVHDFSK